MSSSKKGFVLRNALNNFLKKKPDFSNLGVYLKRNTKICFVLPKVFVVRMYGIYKTLEKSPKMLITRNVTVCNKCA